MTGYARKTKDIFILMGEFDKFIGYESMEEFDNKLTALQAKRYHSINDPSGRFKVSRKRVKVETDNINPLTESSESITLYNIQ